MGTMEADCHLPCKYSSGFNMHEGRMDSYVVRGFLNDCHSCDLVL